MHDAYNISLYGLGILYRAISSSAINDGIFLSITLAALFSIFIYAFFDFVFADAKRFVCLMRIFAPRGALTLTMLAII